MSYWRFLVHVSDNLVILKHTHTPREFFSRNCSRWGEGRKTLCMASNDKYEVSLIFTAVMDVGYCYAWMYMEYFSIQILMERGLMGKSPHPSPSGSERGKTTYIHCCLQAIKCRCASWFQLWNVSLAFFFFFSGLFRLHLALWDGSHSAINWLAL